MVGAFRLLSDDVAAKIGGGGGRGVVIVMSISVSGVALLREKSGSMVDSL